MMNWLKVHKKIIVFTIYACITFSLLFFHESWRDEAQAWLLARDCSIPELVAAMKYEGHFLLWYFILMPFAKNGFPYITTNILSWLITCVSVWLILDKAPFRFDKRVLLIFTFPLLYLFPVVSRCYCLIPLAISLMCIFYKKRIEKPFPYLLSVVLLLNTHVIMAGMVGVVIVSYLIELFKRWRWLSKDDQKNNLICFFLIGVFLLLSIYPLIGCLSVNKQVGNEGSITVQLFNAFFNYPIELLYDIFRVFDSDILASRIITIMTAFVIVYELTNKPSICLKIWFCVFWQCLIYSFIFGYSSQRSATIIFVIVYFKWINTYNKTISAEIDSVAKKIREFCLIGLVLLNIVSGLLYIRYYELPHHYSNACEIGDFINENLNDGSIVLNGSHSEFTTSILPYVKKKITYYSIPGKRYFTYTVWDNVNKIELSIEDINEIPFIFHNKEKLYYICCTGKVAYFNSSLIEIDLIRKMESNRILKKIYQTTETSTVLENYVLYEINMDNNLNFDSCF